MLLALILLTPRLCRADWQLVWSDEFNLPDGSYPDPANWGYDVGGGGWGNNQLEYDTTNNAQIQGGQLVIEARQESYGGKKYTSARMLTKGKWSWTYGRIEARIKIPRGQGIWPAFWTLGENIDPLGWPKCGEIDIMENIGKTHRTGQDLWYDSWPAVRRGLQRRFGCWRKLYIAGRRASRG
ncbi:MAG: glycoside hydrolase family 16 protein [Limisphaerales bacterium]